MPVYADIYALSKNRDEEFIYRFLNHFLPERKESADEYEVPQYSDTPHTTADKLIRYCCENPREAHAIYWKHARIFEHAMVFFLADGGIILGISTPASDDARVDFIAHEMRRFTDTDEILVTEVEPPLDSINEFRATYRARHGS